MLRSVPFALRTVSIAGLLMLALSLPLGGCASTQQRRLSSPGSVSGQPIDIAEYLVEGAQSNADRQVSVGDTTVALVGDASRDLLSIADAAEEEYDPITQYAALHLAVELAPPHAQRECWTRYARLFAWLPATGAAALTAAVDGDVERAERSCGALLANTSVATRARKERANSLHCEAYRQYLNAQGWFDDDEDMIMAARIDALCASKLMQGDSDPDASHDLERLLTLTRGDLADNQAAAANRTFDGGVREWSGRLVWAQQRAQAVKDAYGFGSVSPGVRRLD